MTLLTRLSALNTRFDNIESAATSLPAGQRADIATARTRTQAMALSVPNQLSNFYGNFTQNITNVASTVRSIGNIVDSPTGSICGIVAFTAGADFLNDLDAKTTALLTAIQNGAADITAKLQEMLQELDKVIGFTAALQEIEDYLGTVEDSIKDFAKVMGIASIKELAQMVSCLTHAAEFTANRATLAGKQIAETGASVQQAKEISFSQTNIRGVTSSFTDNMRNRLNAFGGG